MFAEQLQAYNQNPIALAKLHEGLKHIQQEGGLPAQPTDTLTALIHFRDNLRNLAENKYGITIPNPEFEIHDIRLPEHLPQGGTVIAGYPVKYTFGNAIEYAKNALAVAEPSEVIRYETKGIELIGDPERLQSIVTKRVTEVLKPLGLDKEEAFVKNLSANITEGLRAYDPTTLGAVYRSLNNKEIFADYLRTYTANKELHNKADQLLPNVHIQQLWRETKSTNSTDTKVV